MAYAALLVEDDEGVGFEGVDSVLTTSTLGLEASVRTERKKLIRLHVK